MLAPKPARTVSRPFDFGYPPAFDEDLGNRRLVVAQRVLDFDVAGLTRIVEAMVGEMRQRHRNVEATFMRRYDELGDEIRGLPANDAQKLLLGAYFSQEFAFESAALFNPSIVANPRNIDGDGDTSFILSLRGVGEGHISSVTFRTGSWSADGSVTIDPPSPLQ